MGRCLIVVPPLVGHTNPTIPLGRELARRGHAVAWTGHPDVVRQLLPPTAEFIPVADAAPPEVVTAMAVRTRKGTGGVIGFKTLWTDFVLPIARQMLPGVHAAVDAFRPDALLVDEHALAGAAVAEVRGLAWATSATSSADLVDPLATLPNVAGWLQGQMRDLLIDAGVDADRAHSLDPRFSPHLVLAFTIADLVLPAKAFPDHYAFVGPSIGARPDDTPFPWDWISGAGPRILVTLGTVNWRAGTHFFAVAAEAFAGMQARAVFVAPRDLVPNPPPNVLVVPRVPQLALLPHLDAVVCHGGHNTVCESLAHGLPLVVAAVRDDQPIIAEQVVRAGAGVRVKFGRLTVPMLHQALAAVLTEPAFRVAAQRVQASFARAGGARAAADRLEVLLLAADHHQSVASKGPSRL